MSCICSLGLTECNCMRVRSESVGADVEREELPTPFFRYALTAIGLVVALAVIAAIFGGVKS